MAETEAQGIAIAGTIFGCCTDALRFALERWDEFWPWILATPPDTGMDEATSRGWFELARKELLDRLALMEIELDVLTDG